MANEDRLWRIAYERLLAGEKLVLCTLIASHGSTPREAGARMLIGAQGLLAGTVGGGCGEAEVMVSARKVFAGNLPSALLNVDLAGDLNQTETQACGGSMDVYVESLDQRLAATIGQLADSEEHRKRRVVATKIGGGGDGALLIIAPEGERAKISPPALHEYGQIDAAKLVTVGSERWFVQPVGTREVLVIVGSGHVAQPLSRMAAMLGYRIVVIDDRAAFANATNFPDASSIVVSSHAAGLKSCGIDGFTSIVIITRGHQFDEEALREALKHSPRYIGMIGSKRRALATLKRIAESGDKTAQERVHTPIGLDIGAQTPEEIALAIMAEVVAQRRGGSGVPLKTLRMTPKRKEAIIDDQFKFIGLVKRQFVSRGIMRRYELWLPPQAALELVMLCQHKNIRLLGIDAATIKPGMIQPSMEHSIDFTASWYPKDKTAAEIYKNGIDLLEKHINGDFHFEVNTDEPCLGADIIESPKDGLMKSIVNYCRSALSALGRSSR